MVDSSAGAQLDPQGLSDLVVPVGLAALEFLVGQVALGDPENVRGLSRP